VNRSKWLRITLIILGIYWVLWGVLLLFLPDTAENMFGIELTDRTLASFQGLSALFIALVAFMVCTDTGKYRLIIWAFVALLVGEIVLNGYYLISGIQTFQQTGPPIIITAVLLILILVFSAGKATSPGE
jgi:hypothetical protein